MDKKATEIVERVEGMTTAVEVIQLINETILQLGTGILHLAGLGIGPKTVTQCIKMEKLLHNSIGPEFSTLIDIVADERRNKKEV